MKKAIAVNILDFTQESKKNSRGIKRISDTEKTLHLNQNNEIEDCANDSFITLTDVNAYFNRAVSRIDSGDIEGARADFKMAEKLNCELNDEFSNLPLV
ncbi:hypothetical protein ACFLSS_01455 [Bacteroidota bacterium]